MTDLARWEPRPLPGLEPMVGRRVTVEPITDETRFGELDATFARNDRLWEFLSYGPFDSREGFEAFARATYMGPDPLFHAIVPRASRRAEGVTALMRLDPVNGVAEIGHICLGPGLQATAAATEAFSLLFARVFDELGYRRLEWKCDARNAPSRRAAERLGFRFEGEFRQHMVVKNRNRDTAWFSIVDGEWPTVRAGFAKWLQPDNFDPAGRQKRSLKRCRERA